MIGFQIRYRHHTIKPVIGVFNEEDAAYSLISLLMWVLPLTVTISSLLDISLFFLYNKKFHPWSAILAEENRKSDQNKREGFAPDFAPSEMGKVLFKQDIEY